MAVQFIQRPERWAIPFSEEMNDKIVDELLTIVPFSELDPANFRGKVTPRGILKNDCRVTEFEPGEIIVRRGDWGSSAFFIISGRLKAVLESSEDSDCSILAKQKPEKKSLFQLIAQLWSNATEHEVRDVETYVGSSEIKKQGHGRQTKIYLQDFGAVLDEYQTATFEPGQFFGELSALGRTSRQATVFAEEKSKLVEIRWQGLRDLMRGDKSIKKHIDATFRNRAKWFLHNTPIFSHLDNDRLAKLVEATEFQTYGQYDWAGSFKRLANRNDDNKPNFDLEPLVANQGDHPNGVIIVRSGLGRLTRKYENSQKTIGYLGPGQVFGMDEIVAGWKSGSPCPLKYSLRAIGIMTVVVIATPVVEELLLQDSRGRAHTDKVQKTSHFQRLNTDLVEFFVDKRIINGTATMLIDVDRCTRCDDCVQACASTHNNNPRFLRSGPIQNNLMVAGACMHCNDPVCMIECPTGAIHREVRDGAVIINDQTCIGCSACANNCPYGAIRMVEIRDQNGQYIRDKETHFPIVKATKCDLCFDQLGGPACQRACPHGALVRMDMTDVESLANWIKE